MSRPTNAVSRSITYFRGNLRLRKRPLAYVGGWLGQKNLGDEALFLAGQHLFADWSLWPFDGSRTLTRLLRQVPLTLNGLLAGGTMINRCPEYLDIARLFFGGERRLYVLGTGVADPRFWEGRGDFRNMLGDWQGLLNECGYVGVRGPRSAELLTDAGVKNVEVVGDPVVAFAEDEPARDVVPNTLGLNIGYDHGNQWGDEKTLAGEFLLLAKQAVKAGWKVKWFVVFPRDLEMTRQIAEESGTADNICPIYHDWRHYLREVRSMSTFAGMKLHATMLSTCAYVPSLMVEYDPKCFDYMASIGEGAAVKRTDRFRADEAWDLLKGWNANRAARSKELYTAVNSLKRFQARKAAEVAKMMTLNLTRN